MIIKAIQCRNMYQKTFVMQEYLQQVFDDTLKDFISGSQFSPKIYILNELI